jgi:CDP-paratose 2-epimerase
MKAHYPGWDISKSLDDIFQEIYASWANREQLLVNAK